MHSSRERTREMKHGRKWPRCQEPLANPLGTSARLACFTKKDPSGFSFCFSRLLAFANHCASLALPTVHPLLLSMGGIILFILVDVLYVYIFPYTNNRAWIWNNQVCSIPTIARLTPLSARSQPVYSCMVWYASGTLYIVHSSSSLLSRPR